MSDYKAASERTDANERLLIPPFRKTGRAVTWPSIEEQQSYWERKLQQAAADREDLGDKARLEAQQAREMEQEDFVA